MQYSANARPHRHRAWAQGQEVGGLQRRLAGMEPRREDRRVALETLESYRERYRPVADLAGMAREFDAAGPLEVVEDKVGTGSTDFWGISFSPSATEQGPMGEAELERASRCCGRAGRSSTASRRGSRRRCARGRAAVDATATEIIRHTIRVESQDFAKQVGLRIPEERRSRRTDCASIGRPTSRRCARTTPARSSGGCGRGRCRSSSGIRPSTRSTMRGRWRTRTSPPRTEGLTHPPEPPMSRSPCARPDQPTRIEAEPDKERTRADDRDAASGPVGRNMSATEPCSAPSSSASGVSGHTPLLLTKIALSVSTMPSA